MDEGYTQASPLVSSRSRHGVEIVGPAARGGSRQATEGKGFDVTGFGLDWERQRATCPAGRASRPGQPTRNARGATFLLAVFEAADCLACPDRAACTRSKGRGRTLYLHPREEQEALHAARLPQQPAQFRAHYAARAGIEGTLPQGVRALGLRQCRYVGGAKTHLQDPATAAALNFCRVHDWLMSGPRLADRDAAGPDPPVTVPAPHEDRARGGVGSASSIKSGILIAALRSCRTESLV
ncbi:MAG: transposase [Armatimonadetes bacterium]|nr:transposase [Armatimonadota bacterium]